MQNKYNLYITVQTVLPLLHGCILCNKMLIIKCSPTCLLQAVHTQSLYRDIALKIAREKFPSQQLK